MASVKSKEEMQSDFDLFGDIFSMYKKFFYPEEPRGPEDSEEVGKYWDELVIASHEIDRKYNTEFARELIFCVVEELERKWKVSRGG